VSDLHVQQRLFRAFPAFQDRRDAGVQLVKFVNPEPRAQALVLALPRGGVPVAAPLATAMKAPLDVVIARKLPVPQRPEAGFGAVAADGTTVLNDYMVRHFGVSDSKIESTTREVAEEVRRRTRVYMAHRLFPDVKGRDVFMVDDGLATGYTTVAAAKMVRKLQPRSLTLCVPVSPWDSLLTVEEYFDRVYVLLVQEFPPFAVASFYSYFPDITDREVREILSGCGVVGLS
jgi:putative phosphoribosyl transferase